MLHAPIDFPFPGSVVLSKGLRWTIRQLFDNGATALIVRDGAGAQSRRREPVADLVDANLVDSDGIHAVKGIGRDTRRLALYVARHLRDRNEVVLRDLGHHLHVAHAAGDVPAFRDNYHLVEIMRGLGWHKDGYAGAEPNRSPVYRRTAKAVSE
ncbi:hypothetical protein BRX37_08320 [Sphingomonas sp. S-NIH.Pt3_0716]|nr:hypothetical protein BRX37_08320 [Sphingomonas sp. S-NIH.Pt3_0716]